MRVSVFVCVCVCDLVLWLCAGLSLGVLTAQEVGLLRG